MKYIGYIAVLFTACYGPSGNDNSHLRAPQYPSDYVLEVHAYQDSFSRAYMSGANGVLLPEDVNPEGALEFFPPSEAFRIEAKYEAIENGEVFLMETSTDRLPEYRRFGKLHFEVDSQAVSLTLYQNLEYPDYLFCPFKDLTNGKETYGAGRYIDFELSDTLHPIIDFNYAYNPLCAYNYNYSCPIPPLENHLKVRIEAGVKKWH